MRRRYLTSIAIGIAVLWFRRRRYLTSLAIGIAVLWFSQWAWLEGSGHIYNMSPNRSVVWCGAMVNILFALALVIPGFCAGWISRRHGILLGALTGLIGGITYTTLLSPVLHHHTSVLRFFTSGTVLVAFWSSQFGLTLTCAAGGAAGELLRSSNRWRVP